MSEYTVSCRGCESARATGEPDSRCTACATVLAHLPQFLKSRDGRLAAYAMVLQAELDASCTQQICMSVQPSAWARPAPLGTSDQFQS